MLQHPLHRRRLEQVRAEGDEPAERPPSSRAARLRSNLAASPPGQRLHLRPPSVQRARVQVLEVEHHLEERRVRSERSGGQLLHQPLEGHVLVREGAQRGLADAAQRSRTVGPPPRSARRTSVLTKKPISPSSSTRLRPAIAVPTLTSSVPA